MQQSAIQLPAIKLIGITARTNNATEITQTNAKIMPTLQKYFGAGYAEKINGRKSPGTLFCVYTEYASDYLGDYTFLVGEEVETSATIPADMTSITIPPQQYAKFTNGPGAMPQVCISAWQQIWQMTAENFGGERSYIADFEIYDARAADPQNAVLDIYVGIKI